MSGLIHHALCEHCCDGAGSCSNDRVRSAGDLDWRQAEVGETDADKDACAGDFLALGLDDGVHPERGPALVRGHPELRVDDAASGGGGALNLGGNANSIGEVRWATSDSES